MDLFDFFFPTRTPSASRRAQNRMYERRRRELSTPIGNTHATSQEVDQLKSQVRFLTLVLTGVLKRLQESETFEIEKLLPLLEEVDALDGKLDGELDPDVLRGFLYAFQHSEQANLNDGQVDDSELVFLDEGDILPDSELGTAFSESLVDMDEDLEYAVPIADDSEIEYAIPIEGDATTGPDAADDSTSIQNPEPVLNPDPVFPGDDELEEITRRYEDDSD